jgi:HlyD family type I secretion membrane fusion protein
LQERRRAAADILERLDVIAPQSGIVVGLKVSTVGGVIRAGEPILDLVPQQDLPIIEARVKPDDIDVVVPGLDARVRLTAYNSRNVDELEGRVVYVSADRISDPRTGEPYYIAHVRPDEGSLALSTGVRLLPGMSAEVIIRTGRRTALEYFVDPISSSFARAFRED